MIRSNFERKIFAYSIGFGCMLVMTAFVVLALPIFIINEYFTEEYTKAIIIISMGIQAFAGVCIVKLCIGEGNGLQLMISDMAYSVLLLFAAIFIFDGVTLKVLYGVGASLVGGLLAVMVVNKQKPPRVKRRKTKVNC